MITIKIGKKVDLKVILNVASGKRVSSFPQF